MKCRRCKRRYPPEFIQPLVTSRGSYPLCPLCALTERNTMHGLPPDQPFGGEVASLLYDCAVQHLVETGQRTDDALADIVAGIKKGMG